jgi:tripartite-type tricarboxylate transporter receptor subunit TctC
VATAGIYQLPFDMIRDFEPVTMLPAEPNVIVVRKNFPASNLAEMIAWLRQNPDAATAGTSGVGGPSYMSALFFARETGTRIRLIPYRGAGPALGDLVAGQVDMMLTGPGIVLPHRESGAVKVFAVTAKARLDFAPDIPTTDEAGLPGFYFSAWSGLWVPKGTPREIVDRLSAAVRDTMLDPVMEHRLSVAGWEWPPADQMGPAALATFHKAEIEKWVPLVRAAGIKGE